MSVSIIKTADVNRCPKHILLPDHYNPDGTCKCPEAKKDWTRKTRKEKEEEAVRVHDCPVCKVSPRFSCINQNATRHAYKLKAPHVERVQLVDPAIKPRRRRAQWNTRKGI